MRVLNLGWGVQSFTLAAMVALGELESIDAAIHADTMYERQATYAFRAKWETWLIDHGVNVVTVRRVDAERYEAIDQWGGVFIPAYTDTKLGGMLRRQCTQRWKIQPIRSWIRAKIKRNESLAVDYLVPFDHVEQWLGISIDEAERMRSSDVKYITHRWPLIDKRMTRNDCINWLQRHDLEVPVKSSCVFCPYHNRSAWWNMKRENGADWKKAVEIDEAIRKVRPPYDLFVHSDRIPLTEIKSPQDNGQLELFEQEECSGVCFV